MGVFPNNYTYSLWKYNISRLRSFYRSRWCFSTCFCASCSTILDCLSSLILSFFTFSFRTWCYYFFAKQNIREVSSCPFTFQHRSLLYLFISEMYTNEVVGNILNSSRYASAYLVGCDFEQCHNGFPVLKLPGTTFFHIRNQNVDLIFYERQFLGKLQCL